jgi:hypothetical protein
LTGSSFRCGQRRAGQAPPLQKQLETIAREIGPEGIRVGEELCAFSALRGELLARSALGAIFDLLGELFDLLGFFYEGDGEGGACVGMVDLVL